MDFYEYQNKARRTATYPNIGNNYVYPAFGLAGETGEVMEKLKKLQRDHNNVLTDEYREKLKFECGDILWYLSNLAIELGLELEDIAISNIQKLEDRKVRGVLKGEGDNR